MSEELQKIKGITKEFADKLQRRGITSVENLAIMTINDLMELGLSDETAGQVLREAWSKVGYGFVNAEDLEKLQAMEFLTTGSKALDDLLGGGILTRQITELAGDYGSGKSQTLLTTLAENLGQNPDWGAIFLDSEQTFTTLRLKEIAKARGYNPDDIVKRVTVIVAPASEQFLLSINEMATMFKAKNVKIILLDSLIGSFRSEYVGREILWYRQQQINRMLRKLLNYATIFDLAVVVSNQVVASPTQTFTGDIVEQHPPTGGHIVAHNAATRLYFRRAGRTKRIVRLIDSAWRPEGEAEMRISEKGIEDVELLNKEKTKERATAQNT